MSEEKSREQLDREDFEIQLEAAREAFGKGHFASARGYLNGALRVTWNAEHPLAVPVKFPFEPKPEIVHHNLLLDALVKYQIVEEWELLGPSDEEIGFGPYDPKA